MKDAQRTRRLNGSGSISPRRGRYLARLRVRGVLRTLGTYDSEAEAERVLSAAAEQLNSPNAVHADGDTLREVGRRLLDRRELEGLRNVPTDRSRFKCYIEASWLAEMPIKAITARDVRQWVDELAKKETIDRRKRRKVSRATRKHGVNLLRACFDLAIDEGLIESNPTTGLKVRQDGDTGEKWAYLKPEEQQAIATCERIPEADRLRIQFSMYTALRQGEHWSLLLNDVRLDDPSGPHVIVRFWGAEPSHEEQQGPPRSPDSPGDRSHATMARAAAHLCA